MSDSQVDRFMALFLRSDSNSFLLRERRAGGRREDPSKSLSSRREKEKTLGSGKEALAVWDIVLGKIER